MVTRRYMRPTPPKSEIRLLASGLLALLCALLISCGGSYNGPRLSKLDADAVILAFGDSLTYGTGASSKTNSYPSHLASLTGFEVINAGIPGEKTAQGLARLQQVLEQNQPQLVVLCLGGNDMLRKKPRDTMQTNLAEMIEIIQENGSQVVLLGVPAPAVFNLNADPRYQQLANQYAIPLENEIISAVLSKQSLKSDPIHPNDAGYKKMAEAITTLLNQAGAI
jgi:lysophospholipase L1-like esterase